MFFIETFAQLVVWLLVTVLWINLLFLSFIFYRRFNRRRHYEMKDAARERYGPMVLQYLDGDMTLDAITALIPRNRAPEQEAVRELLTTATGAEQVRRATGLLFAIGAVEHWARIAFDKRAKEVVQRAMKGELGPGLSGSHRNPKASRANGRSLRSLRLKAARRTVAVRALTRLSPDTALSFAVEALHDPAVDVRRAAIAALGHIADPRAIPLLFGEIEIAVDAHHEVSLRTAKAALVRYRLEDVHHFLPWLRHSHRRVRFFAVDAVRHICERRSRRAVLNKNDFGPEVYRIFLEELVKDEFADVRARSAGVVRNFRDPAALGALRRLLTDSSEFVRLHAVRACADRHIPEMLPEIARRLTDSNWRVREAAVHALVVFGRTGEEQLYRMFVETRDRYAAEQLSEEMQRANLIPDLLDMLAGKQVELGDAVFRKLLLLGQEQLLLHLAVAPEGAADARLRLLDILMTAPTPQMLNALTLLAETDTTVVGERAAELVEQVHAAAGASEPEEAGAEEAAGAAGTGG